MSLAQFRPRSAPEIVDAAFQFYRNNVGVVVTIAALLLAPPAILKLVTPSEFGRLIAVATNLLSAIGEGAVTAMVAASIERGEQLDVGGALSMTAERSGSLIGVQIATGLMILVGLVLLIVPGFIAAIWTAVAVPVVMIEQVGYAKAISRSRELVRGHWKHVLGTLLLSWGLALLLMFGAGFLVGLMNPSKATSGLFVDLAWGLLLPIPAIAMAFLYHDLRVRVEGADLDAMVSELAAASPVP